MHAEIAAKREAIAELCRRYGVARLEIFGSAARGVDFEPLASDVDFLVTFVPRARADLAVFLDLREALEALMARCVDLVERPAVEASRNYIRRHNILAGAETLYG